jgi:MFS transporter, DHA1 family, inner membrane transport protein
VLGATGYLVTAYALGIAVGAPLITAATARVGRRRVLSAGILVFAAGNVLAAAATGLELLLVVRVVTGSLHGLIAGAATAVAAILVPPGRRGQAIGLVVGGITVATVVGVPAGTLIGQVLGWRAAFVTVTALAGLAFAVTLRFVPYTATTTSTESAESAAPARSAFTPQVLAILAAGFVLFAGQFTAFTYLVPFLTEITRVPSGLSSVFLLVFGLAALVGTLAGGRAADRSPTATLLGAGILLAAALAALYLTGTSPALALSFVAVWGFAGFALAPALMVRALTVAGPTGAGLVPTLVISAINAGIATGSTLGATVIEHAGPAATVLAAVVVLVAAVSLVWATNRLRPRPTTPTGPSADPAAEPATAAGAHAAPAPVTVPSTT